MSLDRQTDRHGPAAFPFQLFRKQLKQRTQTESVLLLDSITYCVWSTRLVWQCLHFYTNTA